MNREALVRAAADLRALGDAEVLDALDAAAHRWVDTYAARAAAALAAHGGASEAMVRFGLERLGKAHRRPALEAWLREARQEAGVEAGALGWGPPLVGQVLAGNVAGLALPAVFEAMLARSAVVLKPAGGDPQSAELVRACLAETHPLLGAAVEVTPWTGGDVEREEAVLQKVDFVVASGGAEAVAAISARTTNPFLGYGPRISIGVVGREWRALDASWFEAVAREIALWDQAGCLSPRALIVVDGDRAFGRSLAGAFHNRERVWPAPRRAAAMAAQVHAFRAGFEMGDGEEVGIEAPRGTAWTVVWDNESSLRSGPPARVVRLVFTPRLDWVERAVGEAPEPIQGVGLAGFGAQQDGMEKRVAGWGVARVALLEAIQDPPAGWRADGRSGLGSLLRAGFDLRRRSQNE